MEEHKFTGDKTKNCFTAYLQESIHWKRYHYLKKRSKYQDMENFSGGILWKKIDKTLEETLAITHREELLLQEREGNFPKWDELSDERLVNALRLLTKIERQYIYQHVFEGRSFEEIARINKMTDKQIKGTYYYAIRKIRKWMGGVQ